MSSTLRIPIPAPHNLSRLKDPGDPAPAIRLSLHDSIHMIHREDWSLVARGASPYVQYDHLLALEDAMSATMEFRYAIYYCEQNKPMGIAYFQVAELVDNGSRYQEAVRKLGSGIGSRIAQDLKVRCLVNGNVFHTGDHGSAAIPGVNHKQRFLAVDDTMRLLGKSDHFKEKVSLLIFKDHENRDRLVNAILDASSYNPMATDVNMVMDVEPDWKNLAGYQEALTSKARTRLRTVLQRSEELSVRTLSVKDIGNAAEDIQRLFDQVLDRAPFVFGRLNTAVYTNWKALHGDDLLFLGYYRDKDLVGFSTAFIIGDTLDVQYVGLDYERNQSHAIYQRILVDLLEFALRKGLRRINFGRTAEQAKSNLGAVPVDMLFHVKHRNALANKIIGPFLRSVKPSEFEQRSPFKKVQA